MPTAMSLIKGPNQTVVGDQAIYDVDQQIGIVTGKALKLTTPTDVVTARDSLEWYDRSRLPSRGAMPSRSAATATSAPTC